MPKRLLLTAAAFLVALVLTAVAAFFLVLFLAGPHGGILPASFETPVLVAGWVLVLVVPAWCGRRAWTRTRE